ncbi:neural proliferation differentiation and control protein 1a [Salarias fasciatus]|uniref:Neural proliferation differentiation and control protein 1-like n=1 Tax=Salarias fasciatus TaxID=181472 RepID=A0A672IWJ8_SALFA|nr:neural proliferation differentiation and control protein 1-like [Salarias fasciatus]
MPPPPLPSSPRSGRLRRASVPPLLALLPLTAALLLSVVPAGSGFPAHNRCHEDCAKQSRQNCPPGSSYCGSCFRLFEENEQGRCVLKSRHKHGKVVSYTDLEGEIDFLHSYIENQQKSITNAPKKEFKHPPAAINLQASVGNRRTDDSRHSQRTQDRVSNGSATAAPRPAASGPPNAPTPQPRATGRTGPIAAPAPSSNDSIIVIVISLCVVVGSVAVIMATVCIVKMQRNSRLAEKVDYPAFRGTDAPAPTANGASMGDKTLAQSAQMYHYQHQKQQMISMGNHKPEQKVPDTDVTSDEEEVGGDFTVYECPGLAPTGEMEVKNPLFDDSTLQYQGNQK